MMQAPASDLRQRLEILRVQGARHRLELAMALETLVLETGGMRRGAATVLSVLGVVAGSGPGKGLWRTVGRGLIPILLSVFAGSRAARSVGHLRSTLEIGALALIVFRYVRRVLRKETAPPDQAG